MFFSKKRYFIVTLVKIEIGILPGCVSTKTWQLGLVLDRYISFADIKKLVEENEEKGILSTSPVCTSFVEVAASDFDAFFRKGETEA